MKRLTSMKKLTAFLLLAANCNVFAQTTGYSCEGAVNDVSVEATTGDVFAGAIGPLRWARLCNVNNTVGNITPAACKTVYATLLTAQLTGKKVQIGASQTTTTSCETHPEWQWMTGFYFLRLMN